MKKNKYYDPSVLDGGTLQEVIVKPTDSQQWLFSQGRYKYNSRKPLGDKYTRKMVAKYLSQFDNENAKQYNARIDRLADMIYLPNGLMFLKNNVKDGKLKNRAHYNQEEHKAYISNMNDLYAELAHPYQHYFGNNKGSDEYNMGNYDSDSDPRGGTRYTYPDTYEGETHGFFEPTIKEYIETGQIGRSLPLINKDKAKQKIVPKEWKEVVDSAKSWNKQAIDNNIIVNSSSLNPLQFLRYSVFGFPLLNKNEEK